MAELCASADRSIDRSLPASIIIHTITPKHLHYSAVAPAFLETLVREALPRGHSFPVPSSGNNKIIIKLMFVKEAYEKRLKKEVGMA